MTPQAQEIVDRFKPIVYSGCEHECYCDDKECQDSNGVYCKVDKTVAIKCAIVAVEMRYYESYKQGTEMSLIRQEYWQSILTELKNELK